MHAFLIVGNDGKPFAQKLGAKLFEFPLKKIDDVRALNSFTSLKIDSPTAIYINSIEEATGEAANAFLKNLEEPQENLYYILTTSSVKKVLPTIVSRCQVVKIQNSKFKIQNYEHAEKFLQMSIGEKLAYLDSIKDREKAIEFMEDFIFLLHQSLHSNFHYQLPVSKNLSLALNTLNALKANGNVALQLANFAISLN